MDVAYMIQSQQQNIIFWNCMQRNMDFVHEVDLVHLLKCQFIDIVYQILKLIV